MYTLIVNLFIIVIVFNMCWRIVWCIIWRIIIEFMRSNLKSKIRVFIASFCILKIVKPTMEWLTFSIQIFYNKLWQTIVYYNVSSSEILIYLKDSNVILASCGSLYFRAGHSIGYWHLTVREKLHVKEILPCFKF